MTGRNGELTAQQAEWDQLERKHIFAINSDPAFLDLLRTFLQEERYNVTTTNFAPRTFNQIVALRPNLLIINLIPQEFSGWDLLERLHSEALTQQIPVIVVSTTPALLDHAHQHRELYGQLGSIALPFDVDVLLHTIHALIGPADQNHDPESPDTP